MVKIVNQFGDVKVGRQGEAVYQRKYGEQIRRTVSPKRAMPSQSQITRRLLYKNALTWRKGLSLANRRYLDGYCIANWVVDNQHIPLPWSRFALKLYLQKVAFVIIQKAITPPAPSPQVLESQLIATGGGGIYANWWRGQSFSHSKVYKIYGVAIMVKKGGETHNPGICTLSIRETNEAGKPEGDDLVFQTFNADDLGTTPEEKLVIFDTPYQAQADNQYCFLCRCPDGDTSNYMQIRYATTDVYPRGTVIYSTTSGSSFSLLPTADTWFKLWGLYPPGDPTPGILHVRHPSLLKVVHKRGEQIVNEYDTLSSLDEEYLTGQVGLDILSGDLIEATTLPGIEYTYKVG